MQKLEVPQSRLDQLTSSAPWSRAIKDAASFVAADDLSIGDSQTGRIVADRFMGASEDLTAHLSDGTNGSFEAHLGQIERAVIEIIEVIGDMPVEKRLSGGPKSEMAEPCTAAEAQSGEFNGLEAQLEETESVLSRASRYLVTLSNVNGDLAAIYDRYHTAGMWHDLFFEFTTFGSYTEIWWRHKVEIPDSIAALERKIGRASELVQDKRQQVKAVIQHRSDQANAHESHRCNATECAMGPLGVELCGLTPQEAQAVRDSMERMAEERRQKEKLELLRGSMGIAQQASTLSRDMRLQSIEQQASENQMARELWEQQQEWNREYELNHSYSSFASPPDTRNTCAHASCPSGSELVRRGDGSCYCTLPTYGPPPRSQSGDAQQSRADSSTRRGQMSINDDDCTPVPAPWGGQFACSTQ